jgi:hypothetical protein
MLTPEERFQRDPLFHHLVMTLYDQIVRSNFTPTELREAVMLAAVKYEQQTIRQSFRN